ncbi:hypothetical protein HY771_00510 [Candidatus Uhrbacteria bacterium]|nr:hypothetical protein [Candidatus Uhrbacteria bacterium]
MFFFIGAAVGGCASVKVRRDLTDSNGNVLGSVEVDQNLATQEGAARLVASVGDLQNADLADRSDLRATQIAAKSVEKGQSTASATNGGQVTSGYSYNQFGYVYGYGGYNGYGQMFPGASPEMMWVEAAGRQSYSLPPLGQTTSPVPNAGSVTSDGSYSGGLATCPQDRMPNTPAEQVACIRQDVNEVLRAHRQ